MLILTFSFRFQSLFDSYKQIRKMVACPDSLVWELTKKSSSFIKKKNGNTKRSGSITFSTEAGNLKSLNQHKYSGLANTKVFNVRCTDDDKAELVVKVASKAGKPSKSVAVIPINKDFKRVESAIKKNTTSVYYRRDLETAALGKYTKVYQANRRAKGIKKPVSSKRLHRAKDEDN